MKYIFLTNFTLSGAGYTTIVKNIALGLVENGHEVMVLGIGYGKEAHDLPFKLVPMEFSWAYQALLNLPDDWGADRVIVALDVPQLHNLASHFIAEGEQHRLWLLEAIFPVESHPILLRWADSLGNYRNRFVISEYGVEQCKAAGLNAHFLPMGCSVGTQPKSKENPRKLLQWPENKTIFLTISDNHERKALPIAMQAFARLPDDAVYYLVTDPDEKLGWDLLELASEYKIRDRFYIVDYGVSSGILSMMYWAADALVVPSLAEGACLPVYEAAAHGLPVIGGHWTGLSDVAEEPWYMSVGYDFEFRFPWGNVKRWYASVGDVEARMLEVIKRKDYTARAKAAIEFARDHPWSKAVEVMESTYEPVSEKQQADKKQTEEKVQG